MSETVISDKVLGRIRALLAKTVENGCTEGEASSAAEMASRMLSAHNVSMAELEATGATVGEEGRRGRATTARSAMYDWQINLMSAIAQANFCKHWVEKVKLEKYASGVARKKPASRHALIGRKVNIVSTNMLYDYLVDTMERLLPYPSSERRSRSAHSWRLGCAARLTERIEHDHWQAVQESREKKERAETEARASGANAPGALVLADVFGTEEDLNEDEMWNRAPGTTARLRNEWQARVAKTRADAEAAPRPCAAPARPVAPETEAERVARAKREKAESERHERRRNREEAKIDQRAYWAGSDAGRDISLAKQMEENKTKKLS
jgi:hypothetical protein